MSSAPKHRYTVEEYLAFEAKSERKHEYYDGEIFAMSGTSYDHGRIVLNLARILGNSFLDKPCEVNGPEMRVRTSTAKKPLYTYPDLVIVCEKPELEGIEPRTLINPRVLIEVLSPSTEHYDRTSKFQLYKKIPSLKEYVLVSQDEARVEVFTQNTDGSWPAEPVIFEGLDTSAKFASVACTLPLADIYRNVEFDPTLEIRRGNPRFDE
jgi:Uma2 family endonuclease